MHVCMRFLLIPKTRILKKISLEALKVVSLSSSNLATLVT